jgi:hypothetical protein
MKDNSSKLPPAVQFLRDLKQDSSMERQEITPAGLSTELQRLRTWQTQRLMHTYQDFLNHPRYGPACRFFLDDVYAPRDFSQRDHDVQHLYQLIVRFVPEQMLTLMRDVIELNQFSNELDLLLLRALKEDGELPDPISPDQYAQAYRICDNYLDRVDQIHRLARVLEEVAEGARKSLVLITLRLARRPAGIAGWGDLQDFLERGCLAFKQMQGGRAFLNAVQERETSILERIFDRHPHPFDVE